jgi:sulfur relay (sulfurtransferase) complex TusBCD TusD component (DsrE family)
MELATMEQSPHKIGFVLGTSPASNNAISVARLANAALDRGHEVVVFLFDDGLYNALPSSSNKCTLKQFHQLIEKGAEVAVCSNMAKTRGISETIVKEGIAYGSLLHFSEMINQCDKVLSFAL